MVDFDPTVGMYTPRPELMFERASVYPFSSALGRQFRTVDNALKTANIKRRAAKPYNKELAAVTKRIAKLEAQILKSQGQEREQLVKDREALENRAKTLTESIKQAGSNDKRVVQMQKQNGQLNMSNHATALWLAQTDPKMNGILRDVIGQTDQEVDVALGDTGDSGSRSVFVAPTGFTGFLFGGGSNN